jgi:hypothetical protein
MMGKMSVMKALENYQIEAKAHTSNKEMACHSCKAATLNTTNNIKDSIILANNTVNQEREYHASRRAGGPR